MYPTNETADRIDFYNEVFKYYDKKTIRSDKKYIRLDEVLNYPEVANDKLDKLEKSLKKNPYKYNNDDFKDLGRLNEAYLKK